MDVLLLGAAECKPDGHLLLGAAWDEFKVDESRGVGLESATSLTGKGRRSPEGSIGGVDLEAVMTGSSGTREDLQREASRERTRVTRAWGGPDGLRGLVWAWWASGKVGKAGAT